MPGLDGTGPIGQGPMTGRGHGQCQTSSAKPAQGFFKGLRYSRMRGGDPKAYKRFLETELKNLENQAK